MKTLFGIFMLGILIINFLGYVNLNKRMDVLIAGQVQITADLTCPKPLDIFYDVSSEIDVDKNKYRKGMPKKKDRKGIK